MSAREAEKKKVKELNDLARQVAINSDDGARPMRSQALGDGGRPEPDGFTSQVFANYEVAQEGSVHGGKKKAALAFTSQP